VGILDVTEKEDLMITCKSGLTIRTSIADIREAGRATQGVKLINLQPNDAIAAITKLDEVEENGEKPSEDQESAAAGAPTAQATGENPDAGLEPSAGEATESADNASE